MKLSSFKFSSLVLLVWVSGCAAVAPVSSSGVLFEVNDIATGAMQTQPAVADVDGMPALLYANKANRVVFQYGKQIRMLDEKALVQGGNRFQLNIQDQHLHALWWSHEGLKRLFFSSTEDKGQSFSPVSVVNDSSGVLAPFSLLRGPNGIVGMTYLDEREPRYQSYFNRSVDYGKTWPRPDQRLDSPPANGQASFTLDFQSVESGSVWVSAWMDNNRTPDSPNFKIVMRRSEDAGLNWSQPKVLFSSDRFLASLTLRAQGDNIAIAADEHERGIVAVTSSDRGSSWHSSGILAGSSPAAGVENHNNSGIRMAIAGGQAHLVWLAESKGQKASIKRGSLDISTAKWRGNAERMDTKDIDNTRSVLPVIAVTAKGIVVSAWVDYRDIRPNIYFSKLSAAGESWSAPQPLLTLGTVSAGQPQLIPWGDQMAIGYEIYPTDRDAEGSFVLRLLDLQQVDVEQADINDRNKLSASERKTKLEQRIKKLWDNRVAGKVQPTYDMMDFAFKAANPEEAYLNSVGNITYHNYSLEGIEIKGNEATVKMKIKYEVKKMILPSGRTVQAPSVEADAENVWVWVGNNWYFVYKPVTTEQLLKY